MSVPLLELKKDQIIYLREKKNDQGENLEKEKLEEIINNNSSCMYEYGMGK